MNTGKQSQSIEFVSGFTEGRITASIDLKALCSVLFPEMRNIPVVRFVELLRRERELAQPQRGISLLWFENIIVNDKELIGQMSSFEKKYCHFD